MTLDKIIGQQVSDLGLEDAFADNEEILWQDRPVKGVLWNNEVIIGVGIGVLIATGAEKWLLKFSQAGSGAWSLDPTHVILGLLFALVSLAYPVYMRRNTWYTLTNRRAIITTKLPVLGKRFKGHAIAQDSKLEHKKGRLASVYFKEFRKYYGGKYPKTIKIGLENIKEGEIVYKKRVK